MARRSRLTGRAAGAARMVWVARALRLAVLVAAVLLPGQLYPQPGPDFDVEAHRGGRGRRPENTLAAFGRALELGVDTLEMDLAVTRDRVVVISPDYRLDPALARGPDGEYLEERTAIRIRDLDFSELRRYPVGEIRPRSAYLYRFREQVPVPGEKIPSLVEVFELVQTPGAEKVRLNLEIKTYPPFPEYTIGYRGFADLVVGLIREHGMESRVTLQSFDWRALERVREQAPEIRIACLTVRNFALDGARYNLLSGREGPSPWLAGLDADEFGSVPVLVGAFGADVWSPYCREHEEGEVAEAHGLGLRVLPWTVDDRRSMETLIRWGVDEIIADVPDVLMEVVGRR